MVDNDIASIRPGHAQIDEQNTYYTHTQISGWVQKGPMSRQGEWYDGSFLLTVITGPIYRWQQTLSGYCPFFTLSHGICVSAGHYPQRVCGILPSKASGLVWLSGGEVLSQRDTLLPFCRVLFDCLPDCLPPQEHSHTHRGVILLYFSCLWLVLCWFFPPFALSFVFTFSFSQIYSVADRNTALTLNKKWLTDDLACVASLNHTICKANSCLTSPLCESRG